MVVLAVKEGVRIKWGQVRIRIAKDTVCDSEDAEACV